jgi:hypothetical protein
VVGLQRDKSSDGSGSFFHSDPKNNGPRLFKAQVDDGAIHTNDNASLQHPEESQKYAAETLDFSNVFDEPPPEGDARVISGFTFTCPGSSSAAVHPNHHVVVPPLRRPLLPAQRPVARGGVALYELLRNQHYHHNRDDNWNNLSHDLGAPPGVIDVVVPGPNIPPPALEEMQNFYEDDDDDDERIV